MIKNIVAVATVVLLSACSSSDDSGGVVTPPGDGTPPMTDTKAGAYIGDFGSGNGVYVISNQNVLSGLALATDGTANSLFGDIGSGNTFNGELRSYFHTASNPASSGVFGPGEVGTAATQFDLNIVNGQTIESLSGNAVSLVGSGTGVLSPASPATVAGTWSSEHRYDSPSDEDPSAYSIYKTEITFSGSELSGRTFVTLPDGSDDFEFDVSGSITEFGDVSLLSFTWNNNTYNGALFFEPGSTDQLVFIGETSATDTNNRTIAALLTR